MSTNNQINSSQPFSAAIGGTGVASPTAHGILIAEGSSPMVPIVLGAGQLLIGTTASDPSAAALTAGTGVSITSASGAITINATGGALTWSTITGATLAAAVSHGYIIADVSAPCVVTLPATAAIGDAIRLNGLSTGQGWVATANTSQTIQFGNQASSSAGSWASTNAGDSCLITCLVANSIWGMSDVVSSGLTKV